MLEPWFWILTKGVKRQPVRYQTRPNSTKCWGWSNLLPIHSSTPGNQSPFIPQLHATNHHSLLNCGQQIPIHSSTPGNQSPFTPQLRVPNHHSLFNSRQPKPIQSSTPGNQYPFDPQQHCFWILERLPDISFWPVYDISRTFLDGT